MSERGTAPIELALGIGLLLVPIVMAALALIPALEARSAARTLAAESARLLAVGHPAGEALRVAGHEPGRFGVGLCTHEAPPLGVVVGRCAPVPGGRVWVTVAVAGPAIVTPFGTVAGEPILVTHVEAVDRHRSLP